MPTTYVSLFGETLTYVSTAYEPFALGAASCPDCEHGEPQESVTYNVWPRQTTDRYSLAYIGNWYLGRPTTAMSTNTVWLFPCCETWCEGCQEVHLAEEVVTCDRCDKCTDSHDCSHCEYHDHYVDYVCERCDRCERGCECAQCDNCGPVSSVCDTCDRCEDCCECVDQCECESSHQTFRFLGFENDDEYTVAIPGGVLGRTGFVAVCQTLERVLGLSYWDINHTAESIGFECQTKRGNYVRRLSSAFYKEHGIKLTNETLTTIGNLVAQHSSKESSANIAFTRNLNMSAEDFYHEDSCWWQSYSASRCALKTWGGIGMRSFSGAYVSGRAWVQPLTADMRPTHDVECATAFIVYNGYGDLDGYNAARIIANLAGMTYRKVSFSADPQYVNGNSGILVSSQSVCDNTDSVRYSGDCHRAI